MASAVSWRDHFKIEDRIVEAFWKEFSESSPLRASELTQEKAEHSVEFILWCVREGHFTEEAFTRFQSEAFNLPVIRKDFFETPIDREFWERVKDLHPWTSNCLPITEWEGQLLIGSVWADQVFKASLHHRLVLATPTALREFYDRFQSTFVADPAPIFDSSESTEPQESADSADSYEAATNAPDDEPLDANDPFAALSRELARLNKNSDTTDDAHSSQENESSDSAEAPEGLVIPEGLSFNKDELARLVGQDHGQNQSYDQSYDEPLVLNQPDDQPEAVEENPVEPTPLPEMITHAPIESLTPTEPMGKPKPASRATPPPPVMPFSPSAAPAPPKPEELAKLEEAEIPPPPVVAPVFATDRPAAEATVVISATSEPPVQAEPSSPSQTESPVKSARKPLFEPVNDSTDAHKSASSVSSGTQTGTNTRARRLESTPVTSFFGAAMGGAASRPLSTKPGRNPDNYLGRLITVSRIEPIHLDECVTIDEAGAQAILQACNIFETAMILLFKDGELQPWKWNDLFLSVKGEKPDSIDLNDPSIFKIVFRTAKPYHGYVVTSTVNQKFFNEFYRGMLPKHATVIPIMIDGRMGGMFLGFTNSKIDYRQSLRLMERLSFDLARVFKMLRGTMAKAS